MYLSAEDARSDVILAGAAAVFGGALLSLLLSAPGVPTSGLGGEIVVLLAWSALSGLVPFLLARYRQDVPGAFGFGSGGASRGTAIWLASPVVVLGLLRGLLVDGSVASAALGRAGRALVTSPVVGDVAVDGVGVVLALLRVGVLTLGSLLLVGFLTVRGRDAFRTDERSATELLRTLGFGAVAVALVGGLIAAIGGNATFGAVGLNVVAAAAIVLVADRTIAARATVARPAVLTPVVLVAIAHVFAAGGLFGGGLLTGLYAGGLAGAVTVVLATTIERGRRAALTVPLVLAVHWWPTCLSPLPFSATGC